MFFKNLTSGNEIGSNCYLLDFDQDGRVVIDAGMHPKKDGVSALPLLDHLPVDSVDAVFVSHAHHDHIGALPVLMREQPHARVYMSEPTYYLAEPLLHNSVEIMLKQRAERGITEYPLFTHRELDGYARVWQAAGLGRSWSMRQGFPDPDPGEALTFQFHDAGHILGSVAIELNHRGRRILYTGDINLEPQTLMHAADLPEDGIDTLIIETTRGSQPRKPGYSRGAELEKLFDAINHTFDHGGAVMIPAFAMGKTQEALAALHFAIERRRIPESHLFIGGLSRSFSLIYDKLAARSTRACQNVSLLGDIRPEVLTGRTIRASKPKRGHIYLISSGMMTERTLSNVLAASSFLNSRNNAIYFIGYTDPQSPAGRLRATPPEEEVVLDPMAGSQPVLCPIDHFDLTAHAQREDMLDYILRLKPRVCVLVHGDPPALEWFQQSLAEKAPGMKVVIPPPGEAVTV